METWNARKYNILVIDIFYPLAGKTKPRRYEPKVVSIQTEAKNRNMKLFESIN